MNASPKEIRPAVFAGMLVLTVLFRLAPYFLQMAGYQVDQTYPWSFSPLLAVCLFGGAYLGHRLWAVGGPLVAWLAGDIAIGLILGDWTAAFYASQIFTYLAIALCAIAGFWLRRRVHVVKIVALGLATPVLFFLVSNFGSWLVDPTYPKTAAGLWQCYAMGIPFFRFALLSQIVFLPVLFSPIALRSPVPQIQSEIAR